MVLIFYIFELIILQLFSCQTILNIGRSYILDNNIEYNCQLSINEIKKSDINTKYIVFNFPLESKLKRNEIYISRYKSETINSKSIYKLALFGSNKIIVPYDYAKDEEYLYIKIKCYNNKKCKEEIIINLFEIILIEEGETLYINGYKGNYIYDISYKFKKNIDNKKLNTFQQITVNSYNKNSFEFEIINNQTEIKNILNGYSYYLNDKDYNNCKDYDCSIDLKIKIIKPASYIMIQIISIDNSKEYNSIEIFRPITGLLTTDNNKRCFYVKEKDNNNELFIDFMVEDDIQSLIYEDNNNNLINIFYSQTIKGNNKFCIKKYYNNIKENIFFYFSIYQAKTESYIRNKSYLGLLYNGYYYKKILSQNGDEIGYYPSEYNDYLLYFYLNVQRGVISLDHIITNNFPYTKDKIEDKNYKYLNINRIGNEYFGTILIKENNIMNSSPMNPNKNILLIDCQSGINFDENDDYCEFNIMFYTQNDIIHLRQNEKFSFLNYENAFNLNFYQLKLNVIITIPLIIDYENNDKYNYKLVIDTYSQLGSSYVELENNYEIFYSKSIKTFYNDNLISNEIVFDYDKKDKIFENNKIIYQFKIISDDCDFVSIIISGTNQNENKKVETHLWLNGYILTTLSKRIPQKKLIIDNLPTYPTVLNYLRTFIIFKYLNCDVKTNIIDVSTQKDMSNDKIELKDKIDNVSYMIISKYLSGSIKGYEFDINLENIYDNEPVCMIYFSGFFIDDLSISTIYPTFVKEDTDIPIIFLEDSPSGFNYEYLILNFYCPIIISVSFEQIAEISLTYIFDKNKVNSKTYKKELIFHYSRNYIIPAEEIMKNCASDDSNENYYIYRDKYICKLQFQITRKSDINNSKKLLLNLKVRMNNNKPVTYLNINSLTNGLILSGQHRYYYSNIRQNDSGYIVLNHKKGIGLMYARIINKNTFDTMGEKWHGRISLITKDQIDKCKDCLIYDINTNEIIFTEEHTKNCNSDLRCQIVIGITNIEDIPYDIIDDNVYEYSIYLIRNNNKKQIFGNLKILSNEYIQATLYENDLLINKNKIKFNYFVPKHVENIKYELQCKKCVLYLILDNNKKIKQEINNENIIKYGSDIIQFDTENQIQFYHNKIIQFEISTDEYEQNNYSTIFFKISLIYKELKNSLILLNSESNTICYKECEYLIPIYDYDKLSSLTMSVSDVNLKVKFNTELQFLIFDSLEYYKDIIYINNNEEKIKKQKIISNKNYIIYKGNNEYKNIIIKAYIKIINNSNDFKNYYLVHFTYNKHSHKSYFLYPNRINLIDIEKNSDSLTNNNTSKEIKFPDYFLINNYQNKNKNEYSSIIKFNYIKGEGVVNLVTKNLYLHNDAHIYTVYPELKTFLFDYSHSFFQINYNEKSKFSRLISIDTNDDLYLYGTISTNLNKNINEIKLGKTNYILYQYDNMPFILYIKINNIYEIKNNISINIKLEGLEIYKIYEWYLTGYFLKSDNLQSIISILDTKPVSIGYYDNITNIGMITFKSEDMINYYNTDNKLFLLIKLIDINSNSNNSIDIMVKSTTMPNKIGNHNNNIDKYSIPQFEYYFSYLTDDDYMSFNLNSFNKNYNYISLELIFSSDKLNYAIKIDISNNNNNLLYQNETNKIKIVDERFKDDKRSIIILLEKNIKEIYLIIFNKDKNMINEKLFFSFKYYYLSKDEYTKGKYLYKNRFIMNNNEIKINEKNGGVYYIYWESIKLLETKDIKGGLKIDYYLKIFNEKKNDNNNNNNYGLFKNFENKNIIYARHLINKNNFELTDIHLLKNENVIINLVAKFNELNGMENYVIYKPLKLFKQLDDDYDNTHKDDINDNKKKDINKKDNYQTQNNSIIYYFIRTIIILFFIIIIIIVILFLYKEIRRCQINKVVNKLIENNNEKSYKNYELSEYNNNNLNQNKQDFDSKISFMIENY